MPFRGYSQIKSYQYAQSAFSLSYHCGHCNRDVSGLITAKYDTGEGEVRYLVCTNCGDGSVVTKEGVLYPPSLIGQNLEGLPKDIEMAYLEARRCFSVKAYTACELICRKILMHVAVEKKAKEGDSFENYIKHLETLGYVTPPMKPWVDLIRTHGNTSTHKLEPADPQRAESTLMFTAELLRIIYEMEHKAGKYTKTATP